jgi:hypothetical protein
VVVAGAPPFSWMYGGLKHVLKGRNPGVRESRRRPWPTYCRAPTNPALTLRYRRRQLPLDCREPQCGLWQNFSKTCDVREFSSQLSRTVTVEYHTTKAMPVMDLPVDAVVDVHMEGGVQAHAQMALLGLRPVVEGDTPVPSAKVHVGVGPA